MAHTAAFVTNDRREVCTTERCNRLLGARAEPRSHFRYGNIKHSLHIGKTRLG
jgi:hypothetical protein